MPSEEQAKGVPDGKHFGVPKSDADRAWEKFVTEGHENWTGSNRQFFNGGYEKGRRSRDAEFEELGRMLREHSLALTDLNRRFNVAQAALSDDPEKIQRHLDYLKAGDADGE